MVDGQTRNRHAALVAWMVASSAAPLLASITASQVLVVYNSQSTDATTVMNAYLAAHTDIPAANVFDLNAAAIANTADISYTDFITAIRNPIRGYMTGTGGHPAATAIYSICLIHGIPHRILDISAGSVGDNPGNLLNAFKANSVTCASVDAELVLLQQNLDTNSDGTHTYNIDCIENPYYGSMTGIQTFNHANIAHAKNLAAVFLGANSEFLAWAPTGAGSSLLTAGDMYLVCRVDGPTVADCTSIINRATGLYTSNSLYVNKKYAWIILDKDSQGLDNNDYLNASTDMTNAGWNVRYESTIEFLFPSIFTRPIIAYASYGENSSSDVNNPKPTATYIEGYLFAPGAIFNTIESYNGRAFNGLGGLFNQAQVSDFMHWGGTFGIGHVWEPTSATMASNDALFRSMLVTQLTWAEAAWTSIPFLSWMDVVVGDPLGRVTQVVDQPADFNADCVVDNSDFLFFQDCAFGPSLGLGPGTGSCAPNDIISGNLADLSLDGNVDMSDYAAFQRCLSASPTMLNPNCAN